MSESVGNTIKTATPFLGVIEKSLKCLVYGTLLLPGNWCKVRKAGDLRQWFWASFAVRDLTLRWREPFDAAASKLKRYTVSSLLFFRVCFLTGGSFRLLNWIRPHDLFALLGRGCRILTPVTVINLSAIGVWHVSQTEERSLKDGLGGVDSAMEIICTGTERLVPAYPGSDEVAAVTGLISGLAALTKSSMQLFEQFEVPGIV